MADLRATLHLWHAVATICWLSRPLLPNADTQAVVMKTPAGVVVAFRGTEQPGAQAIVRRALACCMAQAAPSCGHMGIMCRAWPWTSSDGAACGGKADRFFHHFCYLQDLLASDLGLPSLIDAAIPWKPPRNRLLFGLAGIPTCDPKEEPNLCATPGTHQGFTTAFASCVMCTQTTLCRSGSSTRSCSARCTLR